MIRGDIYWINFKSPDKLRPAVIVTRDSAIRYLNSVTVIPITTTLRDSASTVWLDEHDGMDRPCLINVDNTQTVVKGKVGAYITHLSPVKMDELFEAVKFAFGFDK